MQFNSKAKRQSLFKEQKEGSSYPHSLQFYKKPPLDTITLEEFEDLALERLKVLRLIERAGAKFNKNSQEYKDMIFSELRKQNLSSYCKIEILENIENTGGPPPKKRKEDIKNLEDEELLKTDNVLGEKPDQLQIFGDFVVSELRQLKSASIRNSTKRKIQRVLIEASESDDTSCIVQPVTVATDATSKDKCEFRRRDHISHFILRLAYCRREDLRRWFITQEVDLFKLRFIIETSQARNAFMKDNDLNYEPIDKDEKDRLNNFLYLGFNHSIQKVNAVKFYKVPFIEVLDLVKNRKVFLEKGYAYIPEDDLVITVLSAYRAHLSHDLAITSRALPQLEEDKRLISMLSTLHERYIGTDYTNKKPNFTGDVTPDQIDSLSKTSFPLCMRNLHDTLRKQHHLKYNGRLQYGLFLKGIGLSLDDALRFWREEFTKVMDVDKFDKQYTYNIRYNYGKEGKRANFSPYSCMKIITSNAPGPGEHHGCPFKHSDQSHLKQRLQGLHISNSAVENILDLSTRAHYQIACTRFFEATHNETTVDQGISHPNQYFEESQRVLTGVVKNTRVTKPAPRPLSSVSSQKSSSELEDNFEQMEDLEDVLSCLEGIK